jgi:hypothetical protein
MSFLGSSHAVRNEEAEYIFISRERGKRRKLLIC